jgi:hypothetical protein
MLQTYLLHCTSPKVLSSSEDLLPAELSQACLFEQFPFLEAIWTSLVQSLSEGQLVRIPFVHAPHPKLRGYYHFEFSPTSLPPSSLFVHIINCTAEAMDQREELQRKNEQAIHNSFVNIPT